jgi:hypothetical protein
MHKKSRVQSIHMKYDPVKHDMKMRERERERARSFKFPPLPSPLKTSKKILSAFRGTLTEHKIPSVFLKCLMSFPFSP